MLLIHWLWGHRQSAPTSWVAARLHGISWARAKCTPRGRLLDCPTGCQSVVTSIPANSAASFSSGSAGMTELASLLGCRPAVVFSWRTPSSLPHRDSPLLLVTIDNGLASAWLSAALLGQVSSRQRTSGLLWLAQRFPISGRYVWY